MIKIEISLEKGIEILIAHLEKSSYYYSVVETYFRRKDYIDDDRDVFAVIKDGSPELITYLLELI